MARRALHDLVIVLSSSRVRSLRGVPKAGPVPVISGASSCVCVLGSFCDFGPALRDQNLGIIGEHLERAIRADVVVPV
jgi:hypothetical protein